MKAPALKRVPLFSDLHESDLESLAAVASIRRVEQETVILQAEEEGDTLFIILSGRVSVTMGNEDGREVILSILTAGDFFGEMSLLDGKPRSASVIATEHTELLLLRRADFLYCMQRNSNLATRLVSTLANRLRRTNRQVESLALLNAYGRVAASFCNWRKIRKRGRVKRSRARSSSDRSYKKSPIWPVPQERRSRVF